MSKFLFFLSRISLKELFLKSRKINLKIPVMEFGFWPSGTFRACSCTKKCAPLQVFLKYFQWVSTYSINLHRETLRKPTSVYLDFPPLKQP